jgi:hypothetical protein
VRKRACFCSVTRGLDSCRYGRSAFAEHSSFGGGAQPYLAEAVDVDDADARAAVGEFPLVVATLVRPPHAAHPLYFRAHKLTVRMRAQRATTADTFVRNTLGPALPSGPRVTPLAQLRQLHDWLDGSTQYATGLARVRVLVALIYFLGGFESTHAPQDQDFDDARNHDSDSEDGSSDGSDAVPERNLQKFAIAHQQRYSTAAAAAWEVYDRNRRAATLEFIAEAAGREQWRAMSTPDAVFAPQGAGGGVHEVLLEDRCCVAYVHSAQQRTSSDSGPAVLEILAVGALLSVAREAARRELDHNSDDVPAGLKAPVLIAALPQDWKVKQHSYIERTVRRARLYLFDWDNQFGVTLRRSDPLSLERAFDRINTHMEGGEFPT